MATLLRKTYTKPLPEGAKVRMRTEPLPAGAKLTIYKGRRVARWRDAKGKLQRADVSADGGRIVRRFATWQANGKTTKAEVVTELRRSFDHVIEISQGLSEAERARQVVFFGLTADLGTALTLMQGDMHEHLGQSIAYARMNQIVPPWSR